jgi:hypothetical protein
MYANDYAEVRGTHFDEIHQCFHIDAYNTMDEEEEGRVVAKLYVSDFHTDYFTNKAKRSELVKSVISDLIQELKRKLL